MKNSQRLSDKTQASIQPYLLKVVPFLMVLGLLQVVLVEKSMGQLMHGMDPEQLAAHEGDIHIQNFNKFASELTEGDREAFELAQEPQELMDSEQREDLGISFQKPSNLSRNLPMDTEQMEAILSHRN